MKPIDESAPVPSGCRTAAELGSFRGAGDRLGIAPSAVSQAVAVLEADLAAP
ncbi:helix-turn-helix domain-containing protein [Falsirhodobacter deserti]|uniref:helix-turn-helix domain-containing protein n=1 Tax=Falsirhodobacter deserti TaxID=1365611 RepID=UPI0013E3B132|nr:LysR family transcriptional regulator [Falsirhodobacter deserti]